MLAHLHRRLWLGTLLWAAPIIGDSADLTVSLAALSDFRYRGVSLSDRQPALQAGVDWSHTSGVMAGVLASTVRLGPGGEEHGVAGQAYLGWSGSWTPKIAWSAGVAVYAFPRVPRLGSIDYQELFLRLGSDDVQLGLYASNSYFGSSATSGYLSVSAARELHESIRLLAHVGWLSTGAADPEYYFYDHTRRLDARLGLEFDLRWASVELSVVGATTDDNGCRVQRRACEPAVVLSLRKLF